MCSGHATKDEMGSPPDQMCQLMAGPLALFIRWKNYFKGGESWLV